MHSTEKCPSRRPDCPSFRPRPPNTGILWKPFPGSVNRVWNNCVCLPTAGSKTLLFDIHIRVFRDSLYPSFSRGVKHAALHALLSSPLLAWLDSSPLSGYIKFSIEGGITSNQSRSVGLDIIAPPVGPHWPSHKRVVSSRVGREGGGRPKTQNQSSQRYRGGIDKVCKHCAQWSSSSIRFSPDLSTKNHLYHGTLQTTTYLTM